MKHILMCGYPHKGDLFRGLSRVRENSQARFSGGLGLATAPGYPTPIRESKLFIEESDTNYEFITKHS